MTHNPWFCSWVFALAILGTICCGGADGPGHSGGADQSMMSSPEDPLWDVGLAPQIQSFRPSKGPNCGGPNLELTGQHFTSRTTVTVGGVLATDIIVLSSDRLTARLPENSTQLGPVAVVVTNPDGQSTVAKETFNYHDCGLTLPNRVLPWVGSPGFFTLYPDLERGGGRAKMFSQDLNRDGAPDVIILKGSSSSSGSIVEVLLNDGKGAFSSRGPFEAGQSVVRAAIVDWNHDQIADLAVINGSIAPFAQPCTVSVLLGDGVGGFLPPMALPVGLCKNDMATGDWNNDGNSDLAVVSGDNRLNVILSAGAAGFGTVTTISIGLGTSSSTIPIPAAGDWNGDGWSDLVVATKSTNPRILLNDTKGGFIGSASLTRFDAINNILVADVNGDKKDDLFCVSAVGPGAQMFAMYFGDGKGNFSAGSTYTPPGAVTSSYSLLSTNINNDGLLDLVFANLDRSLLYILLGDGKGSFTGKYYSDGRPIDPIVNDFDGDGRSELLVNNHTKGNALSWLRLDEQGTPPAGPAWFSGISGPIAGDFNQDGNLDLVGNNGATTLLADGSGWFSSLTTSQPFASTIQSSAVADFNGDGFPDLAAGGNRASIKLGSVRGSFGAETDLGLSCSQPIDLAAADFNADGRADLVALDRARSSFYLVHGNALGDFSARTTVAVPGTPPLSVVAGDANGDGKSDVVAGQAGSIVVLSGDGKGGFPSATQWPIPNRADVLATSDLNGDSRLDLVFVDRTAGMTGWLLANEQGGFGTASTLATGSADCALLVDMNADRKIDVVLGSSSLPLTVLLGTGAGAFSAPQSFDLGSGCPVISDFNRDGLPDVLYSGLNLFQSKAP